MGKLVWLGDSDPSAQVVTVGGVTFVKGEATDIADKALFERLSRNPLFGKSADDVAEADEPAAPDPEAGTSKAALKEALRQKGIVVPGNPSEETLRKKLADAS